MVILHLETVLQLQRIHESKNHIFVPIREREER